jgi:uncharacterized protein YbjQ (UPF0145 family)
MSKARVVISTLQTASRPFVEIKLVQGQAVRTRNMFATFFGDFRFIFGGRMGIYQELLKTTRDEAVEDMLTQAESLGADAVIGFRLQNSSIEEGAAEVLAYGTAVKFKD